MDAAENQIVVYQPNETVRLDVRLENETVWLTQAQLCELFGVVKSNVSYHLKNIFGTNELDYGATVQKIRTVRTEAGRTVSRDIEYFNLDVIISLGYRINSRLGIQFRQWATRVLKEYLLHGQVVNQRLALLEDKVDRRLAKHDDRLATLEQKVDFFVQTKEPPLQSIFYQNKFWDAKSLLIKFIRRAKKELIVIDAYPGVATLDMLAKRGRGVKIELVTHSNGELEESDFEAFGAQCGKFTKTLCGICHDDVILDTMIKYHEDPMECKNELISAALSAGGYDNVTIALANIQTDEEPEEEPKAEEEQVEEENTEESVEEEENLSTTVRSEVIGHRTKTKKWKVFLILLLLMIIGCATYIWLAKDNDPMKQTFFATVTPYWNQLMNYMK